MITNKKIVVGTVLFVFSYVALNVIVGPKSYAIQATSEDQLKSLSASLKFKDKDTIEGKLNGTTITFEKKKDTSTTGVNGYVYQATNLESCDGKTTPFIRNGKTFDGKKAADSKDVYLDAYYKDGGDCSDLIEIKTSIDINDYYDNSEAASNPFNAQKQEDSDACVALDSGPLGWVVCPIIDLASTFSQGVFKHFIQPFLEDVPVSSDPGNGAYQAWKQFRTIGYIVMVITMLAVVYAQIKGDR